MNKKEWQESKKKLEELLKTATKNLETAQDQKEELEFTISAYEQKIKTFK